MNAPLTRGPSQALTNLIQDAAMGSTSPPQGESPVPARRPAATIASAFAVLFLLTLTPRGALAQEATPQATPTAAAVARPVHIHSGDCTNLGDVVVPLNDLTAPAGAGAGQADEAAAAESSFTVVPMTLDAILAADHAINVHLSAEEIGTYIACGELGGVVDLNGQLIVGLREESSSGYTGIAFLGAAPDGVSTNVSVFIAPVLGAAG
jgi:hypothetical protein